MGFQHAGRRLIACYRGWFDPHAGARLALNASTWTVRAKLKRGIEPRDSSSSSGLILSGEHDVSVDLRQRDLDTDLRHPEDGIVARH